MNFKIILTKLKQQPWGLYAVISIIPSLVLFGSIGILLFFGLLLIGLFYGEDCEDR